jgi:hypothetical protein
MKTQPGIRPPGSFLGLRSDDQSPGRTQTAAVATPAPTVNRWSQPLTDNPANEPELHDHHAAVLAAALNYLDRLFFYDSKPR